MNTDLLDAFFLEDGDAYARHKLLEAIRECKKMHAGVVREYAFNRFNVTLNFEAREVTLGDDLTVGPQGEYRLSIEEFEKMLLERK
ncbi:MAG: hypothetical protein JSR62_14230 [Nitrospira sp.]|nr:hypothetical protein [Nitrospira sp.]